MSEHFGLIEMLFVFGAVIAFGLWELRSLRLLRRRREKAKLDEASASDAR